MPRNSIVRRATPPTALEWHDTPASSRASGALTSGFVSGRTRRVLYVINDLSLGGAQRVLLDQASGLDPARYAAEVASFELIPDRGVGGALASRGVPVHRLRHHGAAKASAWHALRRLIKDRAPDVVHTHLAAAGIAGRWCARAAHVPCVVSTLHNVTDWQEKHAHPLRWVDRRTLAWADGIVTVSAAVRTAFLARLPEFESRVRIVRSGVDAQAYARPAGAREQMRRTLGLDEGDFVVLAVARLDARKGIDRLVRAVAGVRAGRPLRLVIVGDGPEAARLRSLAIDCGVADRVHWEGFRADVRPWLWSADVFAMPSRTEGLGLAALEALAAGLPVLGARVGGLPEILEGSACGRLLNGDPDAWSNAIEALATTTEPLASWAAMAPQHAARFALSESNAALQSFYDDRTTGAHVERAA